MEENERITLFAGPARFVARDRIRVGDRILVAPKFLVATGARPRTEVGIEGLSQVDYRTGDLLTGGEPMELKTLPRSWVLIGGGFIACELEQMFRRLGSEVILLERGPRLLSGLDEEVADSLGKILEEEGVRIVFHARAVKAAKRDGQAAGVRSAGQLSLSGARAQGGGNPGYPGSGEDGHRCLVGWPEEDRRCRFFGKENVLWRDWPGRSSRWTG